MPAYDYKCDACGHTFEAVHSIKADTLKDCPECKKKGTVQRLISAGAGFLFRGSGFYITDYRSDSYSKAAKAEKESASTPAPPAAAKSETASSTPAPAPAAPSSGSSGSSGSPGSGGSSGSGSGGSTPAKA